MLDAITRLGRGMRSAVALATSALPMLIIGGLFYAAVFVKAEPLVASLQAPTIERRDVFLGAVAPTDDVLWAAGSYGKIVRSEDRGRTWALQQTPVDEHLQAIAAWDLQRAVAVGNRGVVLVTTNGGKDWREVDAPRSDVANKLMQVRAYPNGVAWAVGEVGAVLKTSDYGMSWSRALEEKDQAWNDVFLIGDHGWMVGEFGRIVTTRDGGESWQPIESPLKSSLMSVHFRDALNGVAVGLSGAILVTADGGTSWREAPRVTREHLNCVIWDGEQWVAVGDKGVRVVGVADGSRWTGGRVSDQDLSWRTQLVRVGEGFLLAGANLALLDKGRLEIIGRE